MQRSHTKTTSQLPSAALFLLPGLILFAVFIIGPMLYSLRISFYDWKVLNPTLSIWSGLENYTRALSDPTFQRAVVNTFFYALVTVPAQIILGLGVAILLNQPLRGRPALRVLYYLPVITSWVIVSLLFEYMFSGQAGLRSTTCCGMCWGSSVKTSAGWQIPCWPSSPSTCWAWG